MEIKKRLQRLLFGLSVRQQYVCLHQPFADGLKTFITVKDRRQPIVVDHVFVGYKPVVIAFSDESNLLGNAALCLHFSANDMRLDSKWQGFTSDRQAVARMVLSPIATRIKDAGALKLYTGKIGEHSFLSSFHQYLNNVRGRFVKAKAGNVNLPGNLHDMVRIAYSIPRTIALISVKSGAKLNLFPTDLHGKIGDGLYLSSLRMGGKAQQQVESCGRVVLALIDSKFYKDVYALGKNHMKDLVTPEHFSLSPDMSTSFGFPLPVETLRYYELTVIDSVDVGIHRIYVYKIENDKAVSTGNPLTHIHQYYAQWRQDRGMSTNYLLR